MNLKLQRFFEVRFMTCMTHCKDLEAAVRTNHFSKSTGCIPKALLKRYSGTGVSF